MLKGFLEKVVLNPALVVFILGIIVIVISGFGQLPIGDNVLVVDDQRWRIALGVMGCITTLWGSILLWVGSVHPRRPTPIKFEYDVFVASPMAGYNNKAKYEDQLKDTLAIISALQSYCGIKTVYYAGMKITSVDEFEPTDIAAEIDLEAIRKSRTFVMLYPEEIVTSVLFEAGFALALGRTSVYFVKDREHLPFLMRSAPMLSRDFPDVKIYSCEDHTQIVKTIASSGKQLLSIDQENKLNIDNS
jgi:hypothetical protein